MRAFETQFADWTEVAKVCIAVKEDKDYELLGYTSWDTWLITVAPRSRSYVYFVVSRYKELSPDISEEELAKIPVTSTDVLRKLPKDVRRNPAVQKAAQAGPKKLRKKLAEDHPEQHVEARQDLKMSFSLSQLEVIEDAWEAYRYYEDEAMSLESFIEWTVQDWMDGLSDDGHRSRRQAWEALKAVRANADRDQKRQADDQERQVIH